MARPLRTLLLDNYDSYTYNLYQLLAEVNSAEPIVFANDRISLEAVSRLVHEGTIDNIVISPGPGTPERSTDVGVCLDVLKAFPHVPILGVCLGHQALAHVHGARVVKAPEPVHGRVSSLQHSGHALMRGIPSGPSMGFDVVRYHSLVVDAGSLPPCLEALAWTCGQHHAVHLAQDTEQEQEQPPTPPSSAGGHGQSVSGQQGCGGNGSGDTGPGTGGRSSGGSCALLAQAATASSQQQQQLIMGLAHRDRPHFGVQFHPESVSTRYGIALLRNFCDLTRALQGHAALPRSLLPGIGPPGQALPPRPWPSQEHQRGADLSLAWERLPGLLASIPGGSETVFRELYGWGEDTFWLDSSATDRGRFSYMGGRGGRLWRRIVYRLPDPNPSQNPADNAAAAAPSPLGPGLARVEDAAGRVAEQRTQFLPYLASLLQRYRLAVWPEDTLGLPFNFWGGLVGYLGYELKAECGAANAHRAETPDAAWMLADRLVAIDHRPQGAGRPGAGPGEGRGGGDVYVLAMHGGGGGNGVGADAEGEARAWLRATAERLRGLAAAAGGGGGGAHIASRDAAASASLPSPSQPCSSSGCSGDGCAPCVAGAAASAARTGLQLQPPPPFRLRHSRQQYMANIEAYRQALYDGESYEVCATTALERPQAPDPARLYSTLRSLNPAPYAAWFRFGGPEGPTICCSSPERFLRCDRGSVLEARPIKGTAPRCHADPQEDARLAAELASSEKERAENLMIVDLMRNDLGRVCEVGSVHVPGLMEIESFATVHQMVSTVRGLRRPEASIVDCLRASFPGGSMTGAPKMRTMEILDAREGRARGVYSGSLGFLAFNDTFDLNIVIRTAIITQRAAGQQAQQSVGRQSEQQPLQRAQGSQQHEQQEGRQQQQESLGERQEHSEGQQQGREQQAQQSASGQEPQHTLGQGQEHREGQLRGLASHGQKQQQQREQAALGQNGGPAANAYAAGVSGNSNDSSSCNEPVSWVSIGAGGAIVVQSDTGAEYEEMRLKARALLQATGLCDGLQGPAAVDDAAPAYSRLGAL